jgi:hypothetical protein
MTQPQARSQARNSADIGIACMASVFRSLSRSGGVQMSVSVGARNDGRKEEKLTFTEVRHACAVLLNVCIESRDRLSLGCDLAPKRVDRRFCLLSLLALAFKHCKQHQLRLKKQVRERAGAIRTTNKLNLLYLALIRLLFHALSAFREPGCLRGVRFPALVDLCDGAGIEVGDGL